MMIEYLDEVHFRSRIGQTFRLSWKGEHLSMNLREVMPLGSSLRKGGSFAVYFDGPEAPVLPQAIYRLQAECGSVLDIFMVPIARTAGGIRYEAIFT